MRKFTWAEHLLNVAGFLLETLSKCPINENCRLTWSGPQEATVGGIGGALTSGGDSWGKRMGVGIPRCARGTEVKPGAEVQVASKQGGYGPHEGAAHCHVRI